MAPPDENLVRVGRRSLPRQPELHNALVEAHALSQSSTYRCYFVISLAKYYDGARDGFVVTERATGKELAAAIAIVAAL